MNMHTNDVIKKAIEFESFVFSVIKQMALKEDKYIIAESDINLSKYQKHELQPVDFRRMRCDAIAPHGIGEIKGPVTIEVKYNPGSTEFKRLNTTQYPDAKTLYIVSSDLSNSKRARVSIESGEVIIWDANVIKNWRKEYPIDYYTFYKDEKPIESDIQFEDKVANNKRLLIECIKNKRLSFALGAGVSIEYGNSNWEKLIDNFYYDLSRDGKIVDPDGIKRKIGGTSLINGQFVEENSNDFISSLHKEMYDGKKAPSKLDDTTLSIVASMVNKKCYERRFNVVTYNYDDILEKLLDNIGCEYNSIYKSDQRINEMVTIYHAHGYIPRGAMASEREIYKKSVVFSETAYYRVYNDPNNWSNILQQNIYRENTFLFIGTSLSDPYLRKILDSTKRIGEPHFCFMLTDNLAKLDQLIVHKHFARMGVECIWFEGINEYKDGLRDLENEI